MRESGEKAAKRATVGVARPASRTGWVLGALRPRATAGTLLALASLALGLAWPAGAPGLRSRGHAFAFAFGRSGSGAAEFLNRRAWP